MLDAEWTRWILGTILALIFGSYIYTNRALVKVWEAITMIRENELSHVKDLERRVERLEERGYNAKTS